MGQMKKLYEIENQLMERAGVFYMNRTADLQIRSNQALDLIRRAEFLLNDWLVDNTNDVFEEQPDIDTARGYLNDAIELLEGPNDTKGSGIQDRRSHEDGDHPRSGSDA